MIKRTSEYVNGKALAKRLGFYFCVGLFMFVAPIILYLDMVVLGQTISETSITEILQESFLLFSLFCFLALYVKSGRQEPFFALAAAFYGVLFIREMDMFLDAIVHGFWKYPALLVAGIGITVAVKAWQKTRQTMFYFLESPGGIFTAFGVLLVLFFSRIFGSSKIWEPIMQDNYLDIYKAAIQEGIELYGYSIIFIGALIYTLGFLKTEEASDEAA